MIWLNRLWQKIVPAARGSVSWRQAIPLVLFFLLFALVCFSVLPTPRLYLSDQPLAVGHRRSQSAVDWDSADSSDRADSRSGV